MAHSLEIFQKYNFAEYVRNNLSLRLIVANLVTMPTQVLPV